MQRHTNIEPVVFKASRETANNRIVKQTHNALSNVETWWVRSLKILIITLLIYTWYTYFPLKIIRGFSLVGQKSWMPVIFAKQLMTNKVSNVTACLTSTGPVFLTIWDNGDKTDPGPPMGMITSNSPLTYVFTFGSNINNIIPCQ